MCKNSLFGSRFDKLRLIRLGGIAGFDGLGSSDVLTIFSGQSTWFSWLPESVIMVLNVLRLRMVTNILGELEHMIFMVKGCFNYNYSKWF